MVKIFISHSHRDRELAILLTDVITSFFVVPEGELLCTSVPGYELSPGDVTRDKLCELLKSAEIVIALLSANSLLSEWVLFELGAAWVLTKRTIPLLVGNLSHENLPASLKGVIAARVDDHNALRKVVYTDITRVTNWQDNNRLLGESKIDLFLEKVSKISSCSISKDIFQEILKNDQEKLNNLADSTQAEIIEYLESNSYSVDQVRLASEFKLSDKETYFRLENLRLLGLVYRTKIGLHVNGNPKYSYSRFKRN